MLTLIVLKHLSNISSYLSPRKCQIGQLHVSNKSLLTSEAACVRQRFALKICPWVHVSFLLVLPSQGSPAAQSWPPGEVCDRLGIKIFFLIFRLDNLGFLGFSGWLHIVRRLCVRVCMCVLMSWFHQSQNAKQSCFLALLLNYQAFHLLIWSLTGHRQSINHNLILSSVIVVKAAPNLLGHVQSEMEVPFFKNTGKNSC